MRNPDVDEAEAFVRRLLGRLLCCLGWHRWHGEKCPRCGKLHPRCSGPLLDPKDLPLDLENGFSDYWPREGR